MPESLSAPSRLHLDVGSPGVLQGWRWKSLKISAAFVVVGSPLSSLPWPLRLPSPADPPPSSALRSGIREKTLLQRCSGRALPPPLKGLSLSLACPWGSLACCCQTNTAKIFFPVSLAFCLSGHISLFCLPLSLLSLTSCSLPYHPLSILLFLPPSFFFSALLALCVILWFSHFHTLFPLLFGSAQRTVGLLV